MPNRSKQTPPVVRAGIYTRISWDPEGQRAGVERQRVDCEALCASRGWEIAQYFEDNDASAYSGKPRRAYERMLSAVEEGAITGIVTWHNDRLHRSPRELEAFIDLMEGSGVRVAVVTGGDYDLTTPEGRFTARILGAVARKESEDRSRRVRRKHLELAEHGKPAGQLGWGVRNDAERELVREAAQRVLAGQGLMTIARDWNRRCVPGATEHPWTAPTLRKVLLSARIAGLREHGTDPSGKVLGALTTGIWEGAIDRQTWDHVRSVLLNPERLTLRNTPTKYLLTGLIYCGVCGGRMLSRPRDDHTKRYVCAGRRAGHQPGILAQPVDDLVVGRVLELLSTPAFQGALLAQCGRGDGEALGKALAELGSAQSRLQTLDDDYYVRGVLAAPRYGVHMNRKELVSAVAAHTGLEPRDVDKALRGATEVIEAVAAKGEQVTISGFAKFARVDRPARMARNPATGEPVKVKASKKAKITPLKGFKDAVMRPSAAPKLARGVWPPAGNTVGKATAQKRAAASSPKRAPAKTPVSKAGAKRSTPRLR